MLLEEFLRVIVKSRLLRKSRYFYDFNALFPQSKNNSPQSCKGRHTPRHFGSPRFRPPLVNLFLSAVFRYPLSLKRKITTPKDCYERPLNVACGTGNPKSERPPVQDQSRDKTGAGGSKFGLGRSYGSSNR